MRAFTFAAASLAVVLLSLVLRAAAQPAPPERVVDIAAERFSFNPSEVRATVGTTLRIRLTSDDTMHGFRIVGANVNVAIPKRNRGTSVVTFRPEKPGRYTFECSRLCGAGHSFMRGTIVVTEPEPAP
jgi:cytochrome c oxidase subunit 2